MKIQKTCLFCGKEFITFTCRDKKFCCRECAVQAKKKTSARIIVCLHCGKTFNIKNGHTQKFCCRECYSVYTQKNGGINAPVDTRKYGVTVNDIVFRTRSGNDYEYWADFNTGF